MIGKVNYENIFDRNSYRLSSIEEKIAVVKKQKIVINELFEKIEGKCEHLSTVELKNYSIKLVELLNRASFPDYEKYLFHLIEILRKYESKEEKEFGDFVNFAPSNTISLQGLEKIKKENHKLDNIKICDERSFFKEICEIVFNKTLLSMTAIVYLQKPNHYVPVYVEIKDDKIKIFVPDSLPDRTHVDILFEALKHFKNIMPMELYLIDFKRQHDMRSCVIYSLDDLNKINKINKASNIIDSMINHVVLEKEINGVKFKTCDSLPLQMMQLTQSVKDIKNAVNKKIKKPEPQMEEQALVRALSRSSLNGEEQNTVGGSSLLIQTLNNTPTKAESEEIKNLWKKVKKHISYDENGKKINQSAIDKSVKYASPLVLDFINFLWP